MAKSEQILNALSKLYDKRAALDKQILEAEKKLVAETGKATVSAARAGRKTAPKVEKTAKSATSGKPRGRKPASPKP